ncbi:class F sortase [Streptomyces sp. NPDC048643]|uniref:class F sortase n=1 Tax=Streptomyces sp. NPDC048643 TaxID=3155637 RepID=UPI00343D1C52
MAARSSFPAETHNPRRRLTWIVWCAGIAIVMATSVFRGHDDPSGPTGASRAAAAPAASSSASSAAHPSGTYLPRAEPTRLLIPKIEVDAPFTELTIDDSGRLEPPPADDVNLVGWYAKGVSPGERGAAIIAGHVDTKTSAAVFAGLSDLKKGDKFSVKRSDGRTATFAVDSSDTFEKDDFPDERVYADTPDAQVRLITCAGNYDRSAKDYTENLVVFAHLV